MEAPQRQVWGFSIPHSDLPSQRCFQILVAPGEVEGIDSEQVS